MKHVLFVFCVLLFAAPAQGQEPRIDGFEIIRVGIYDVERASTTRDADGVLQNVLSHWRLAASTTSIPARLSVTFGIEYRIIGEPDGAPVSFRRVFRFPQPGARPPGSSAPLPVSSASRRVRLNQISVATYTLQEPWELMSGLWVLEIWHGDRKLGELEFTLVPEYAGSMHSRIGPSG